MRFKRQITLAFAGLTALIFLMIGLMMYFLTEKYTRQEYFTRLKLRSEVAAKSRFGASKLSNTIYREVRKQHLQVLPDEKEYIIKVEGGKPILHAKENLPSVLIRKVIQSNYAEYTQYGTYFVATLYRNSPEETYIVAISATDPVGKQDLQRLKFILLFCFLVMSLLAFIIGNWFATRFTKPLSKMIKKVNNISAYNLDLRLDPSKKAKGEMEELAITFNNMLDRLETAFQIQNNFVSNASHELRTPLTAILGAAELALMNPQGENKEALELIYKQASRLNDIINGLLKLAQSGYNYKKQLNDVIRLDELLLSIIDDLNVTNPDNQVQLDFSELPEQASDLALFGTEPLLRLAINNIIQNACKYSDNKPVLVKLSTLKDKICVRVSDQGIGIPQKDLEHIFELFFRASNHGDRMGFGLGLPLSYRIFKVHQAILDIQSVESKGTDVYVYFYKKS
ncbi:sensor histidine kinase [Pedobacter glucosidilyticus]|uniref:sensor histidine kinase n=1 Tax=Pedobacter glucosidilyticus TaxID=1122941 RepID=UPI0003FB6C84|nr:HAMP domain-containing sensor histidine kinase [Pedobacter glucosidilyticus]